MRNVAYLSLEEVLALHHDLIEQYGGSHGIRSLDLLISAISRPQASFGGNDLYPSIFSKAAALMHSIIFNHPFVDGNKRTSITAAARFIYLNGYQITVTPKKMVAIVISVESKKVDIEKLSTWLKKNSRKKAR